jgi:hypothetical protein
MHLKDPHSHWEMIQALENRFRFEECSFNSIFGTFEGHRIYAGRKVADTDPFPLRMQKQVQVLPDFNVP